MRTMNYVLTFALLVMLGSCSNETLAESEELAAANEELAATDFRGRIDQDRGSEEGVIENVYLELHLHQLYLENRDAQLVLEIEEVMARLDAGEGNEEEDIFLLEELQVEKATNLELFEYNNEVLVEIGRIALVRPPKLPCDDEVDPYTICPVPRLLEYQIWIFDGQRIESAIQEADRGEICGRFSGLEPVEGPDEFSMMVFEETGNERNPTKLRVTKPNPLGEGTVSYFVYYGQ